MGRFVAPIGIRLGISKKWDYQTNCVVFDNLKGYMFIDFIKRWFLFNISKKIGILLSHIVVRENVACVNVLVYIYPGKLFDDFFLMNKGMRRRTRISFNFFFYVRNLRNIFTYIGYVVHYWSEIYWHKPVNEMFYSLYKNDMTSKFIASYLKIQLKRGFIVTELIKYMRKKMERNKLIKGYRIDFAGRFRRKERAEFRRLIGGVLPTSSVKSDVDYWHESVVLKYGVCSIKVWLYKVRASNKYICKIII
jgi:hypothetical protein